MKKSNKLIGNCILGCLLMMTTTSFAADSNFSAGNSEYASIQMSRGSDNRPIKAVPATNIPEEEVTGRIDMSRGSNSRHVVAEHATNISIEEPTGRIDMSRGSNNRHIVVATATNIQ